MPQNGSERPFPPICVHSFVPTVACATGAPGDSRNSVHCHLAVNVQVWNAQARVAARSVRSGASGSATHTRPHARGRVAVQFTLPNGIERTEAVRSGSSGSAIGTLRGEWQCPHTRPHAQGRVAVQLTLPNGIERTEAVRSGSSGSVIGTIRGEWQCSLHCHSAVNVWGWNVQARVAVRSVRSGSDRYAQGRVAVQVRATFGPAGAAPSAGMRPKGGHPEPCPERSLRKQRSL